MELAHVAAEIRVKLKGAKDVLIDSEAGHVLLLRRDRTQDALLRASLPEL